MKRRWMFKATRMIVFAAAFIFLASAAVMLLWNALIPVIFGGSAITWIQALGLLILARILVGGRGRGGFGGRGRWRRRWESRIANMSPEERKRWKEEAGRYCGGGPAGMTERPTEEPGPLVVKT